MPVYKQEEVCSTSGEKLWSFKGMDASLSFIEDYMQRCGPFDAIMGFSQGATAATLISLLQHLGIAFQVNSAAIAPEILSHTIFDRSLTASSVCLYPQGVPKIQFLVLVSGQKCRDAKFAPLYTPNSIPCPAVLIVGDKVCGLILRSPSYTNDLV